MSAFSSIAQQWNVSTTDIADALKAGTINVKEAATLLERIKFVDTSSGQHSDDHCGTVEINSYEGLKAQLAPEHLDKYDDLMKLRGFA